ncbi:hypothetical protein [Salinisphaera sp.]|uniref:hypothetical protein n=1 Tax=Salinisphaera sp. TaxID=1914330 RepID=UPI0025D2917A|nr:hypothetical protein [Salinisphaera sp.]
MNTNKMLRPAFCLLTGAALAVGTATAIAQQSENASDMRCFNGYGYTLEGGDYRYTEHHEQRLADGKLRDWDVTYVGRNGETIATKQLEFADSDTVPTYTLEIPASGYREGIRHEGGEWTMFRRESRDAEEQTKTFTIDTPMAADSGFDPLVRQRFDDLTAGQTVAFNFAAAGRQAVIKLRAKQTGTTTFEGKQAVVFDAELDMFLVNFFVDSLKLTYDPDSKRLLEYRGIGNMHNDAGEVYPVRVTYASDMPAEARSAGAPSAQCGAVNG